MTEEEAKPVSADQKIEAAPQQEQMPLTIQSEEPAAEASVAPEPEAPSETIAAEAEPEIPAAEIPEAMPNQEGVPEQASEPAKAEEKEAPIEEAKEEKEEKSAPEMIKNVPEEKTPLSKIIGIIAVVIVILIVIFYATRKPAAEIIGNDGQTVRVSSSVEQGKVSIIEETKNDINVLVDSDEEISYPQEKVTVYVGNTRRNTNSADCSRTYPLEREIDRKYDSNMINAMIGLLTQLSTLEKEQGYVSAIPGGTYLKYLKLDDTGVMSVNLSGGISKAAGSCAVTAIKAQIRDTISQFAAVKSVIICIDGNCKDSEILQP